MESSDPYPKSSWLVTAYCEETWPSSIVHMVPLKINGKLDMLYNVPFVSYIFLCLNGHLCFFGNNIFAYWEL